MLFRSLLHIGDDVVGVLLFSFELRDLGAFPVAARFERFDFFYCFAAFEFQFDGFVYGKLTVRRREARVTAVCGFLPRQRVCVRRGRKSPRCTDMQRTKSQSSNAIAILRGGAAEWMSFRALRGSEGYGACADEGASIAFG